MTYGEMVKAIDEADDLIHSQVEAIAAWTKTAKELREEIASKDARIAGMKERIASLKEEHMHGHGNVKCYVCHFLEDMELAPNVPQGGKKDGIHD
jgi:uncharacterized coiled-coil DUF342 family protein